MHLLWEKSKPLLLLLIVLLVAYLPLSTFVFGMKNDAFSDNFPQKFFLSQCIHTGNNPMWNPYMNFGFPTYADMGFAFYNPLVWLLAAIGYTAYLLTAEVLLYIYIGGVCMYALGRYFSFSKTISFTIGVMYMCSGFFIGAIQHINSIAAAAFLPLLLLFALRLFDKPSYTNSFLLSLPAYMVVASGHPGMPIATAYFVLILLISAIVINRHHTHKIFSFLFYLGIAVGLCLLYFLPAIYSYINIFPEYERYATEVPYDLQASAESKDIISLISPFSTISHSFFQYDVSFRNLYISTPGFLALFFFKFKENKWTVPLLVSGIFLFVLSLGEPVRNHLYNYLPLIKNVRTNGHFNVFIGLVFSCLSGFGMQALYQNSSYRKLRKLALICLSVFIITIAIILLLRSEELLTFYYALQKPLAFTQRIKSFYEAISFPVALLCSLLFSVTLLSLLLIRRQLSQKWVTVIIVADVIINSIIYLPVTGVGTTTIAQIQQVYNSSPDGIPAPSLIPIKKIDTLSSEMTGLTGSISYYNKQIGILHLTDYPSYFTTTDRYFKSSDTVVVNSKPYVFFKSNKGEKRNDSLQIKKFEPSHLILQSFNQQPDTLVYLQNHYKYWKAVINGQSIPVETIYHTFMSLPVAAGNNTIEFSYSDPFLGWFAILSFIIFFSATGFYFYSCRRVRVNDKKP